MRKAKERRGRLGGAAVVLAFIGTLLAPTGAIPARAAVACSDAWSSVASPRELKTPRAILALDPDDAWIVGTRGIDDGVVTTGAEHWDGERWTLVPTPNVGSRGENALGDVDGLSGNDLWAVGYSTPGDAEGGGNFKTLVQRWNGSAWTIVPSPNPGGPKDSSALAGIDVLPSGKAWAVGYHRAAGVRTTLIEHWSGSAWSIVPSPDPGSLGNALLDVAAVHGNNVWAVGWQLGPGGLGSLIQHWDGSTWTTTPAPQVGSGDNVLTRLDVISGSDIWAVGYGVDGPHHRPLTLHYDGVGWSAVPPPDGAPDLTVLRGVGATAHDDVWAVGASFRPGSSSFGAWSQHWDGSRWTAVPNAASSNQSPSELHAVTDVPGSDQIWAAGRIAVVETICPTGAPAPKVVTPADRQSQISGSLVEAAPGPAVTTTVQSAVPIEVLDVAAEAGLAQITKTRGAVIDDFTGDGRPDIFLGRHQKAAKLYRNDGSGRFSEILAGTFGPTDRHGCDAADVDGSGTLDLYCAVGAARGTIAKRNELYLQAGDGTFADVAWSYGVLEPYARGRSGTFVDADGLGGPDLFVANFPDRADGLPSPNRVFINEGAASFRAAPEFGLQAEVDSGAPSGSNPVAADIDLDGWEDIVMDTARGLIVYRNVQGTRFENVARSIGLTVNPVDLSLADVDGDGDLDIVSLKKPELRILRNDGGTFRSVFTTKIQDGKAVASGDVNGDGRPDVYVMTGKTASGANAPDLVFLNDGTGTAFASMGPIPSVSTGVADSVWPIDHDGNGLTDFLVLNGKTSAGGPVQLIAFFPSS